MSLRSVSFVTFAVLAVSSCRSAPGEDGSASTPQTSQPQQAPAQQAPMTTEQGFQAEGDRINRIRERQEFLAQQYIERGDELYERADLEGALREYAQAIEVMPSNEAARDKLRQVQSLMGDRYAQAGEFIEDEAQRQEVRRAQARIAAEQHVIDGDNFMRSGDFDRAVESYRRAETVLRYHPLIATGSLDEQIVGEKIRTAAQMAEEADSEASRVADQEARQAREARESEERRYRENKLRTLYSDAHANFQRERYGVAETLAEQILLLDPGNQVATEMRDIARQPRHQKRKEENLQRYRENWIRTFEQLDGMAVPQVETVVFDDLKRWREVSQRGAYEFSDSSSASRADNDAVLRRLGEIRIQPRFGEDGEGAPLDEIAAYLQQVTGVNFIVSQKVTDELDEDETSVYLDLTERSVENTLNLITEVRENLRWKIDDGVVQFVTAEELTGGQVLRMYEVRDLIRPISDFPGREINVTPSGGAIQFDEDLEEREALILTEDALDDLIRTNVSPDSWDADEANSLRISTGTMVVNQTPEVQDQIQKLLTGLREATGIMVDIQARFLKVQDSFLEDIGVDFRGLGAPGQGSNEILNDFGDSTTQQQLGQEIGQGNDLGAFFDDGEDGDVRSRVENLFDGFLGDEDVLTGSGGLAVQWTYLNDLELEMILRAVSKSERVELVTAPNVLVFNTARSNLTVMNQVAYVQDFDVEIAQSASIADPIVAVVEDGVVLDVRPVVSADRRFITLELRPTVAELQRPIGSFTTSLGSGSNTVTIQLPELEISRVRTSVPMPDGGTVLLGGFKVHDSQDLRSGVPILNKIPVLSFFFERKGTFISNRKLLILLKADIVIPREHEPTAAQLGLDVAAAPR